MKWAMQGGTNVETQTFYVMADNGHIGMAQVIYSSVAGIRTTAQFNTRIFFPDDKPILFSSDPLDKYGVDQSKLNFHAQGCKVDLSEDGKTYHINSTTNKKSVVDLKFTQTAPGFVVGKNGFSTFGTDPKKPWGSMRHAFWPRCKVEGSIITPSGPIDFKGMGMLSHALQGMKPHHAGWSCCSEAWKNSADRSSCEMELCQLSFTDLQRHLDGVCYSTIIRLDDRQCRWNRDGWQDPVRRHQQHRKAHRCQAGSRQWLARANRC